MKPGHRAGCSGLVSEMAAFPISSACLGLHLWSPFTKQLHCWEALHTADVASAQQRGCALTYRELLGMLCFMAGGLQPSSALCYLLWTLCGFCSSIPDILAWVKGIRMINWTASGLQKSGRPCSILCHCHHPRLWEEGSGRGKQRRQQHGVERSCFTSISGNCGWSRLAERQMIAGRNQI